MNINWSTNFAGFNETNKNVMAYHLFKLVDKDTFFLLPQKIIREHFIDAI